MKSFTFEIGRNGAVDFSKAKVSPDLEDHMLNPKNSLNIGEELYVMVWKGKTN